MLMLCSCIRFSGVQASFLLHLRVLSSFHCLHLGSGDASVVGVILCLFMLVACLSVGCVVIAGGVADIGVGLGSVVVSGFGIGDGISVGIGSVVASGIGSGIGTGASILLSLTSSLESNCASIGSFHISFTFTNVKSLSSGAIIYCQSQRT